MGSLPIKPTWQQLAAEKKGALDALIPKQWRLPTPLPAPEVQKDVTGTYVHQFLSKCEIEITESDVVDIVKRTTTGTWTAVEVVTAFCHRAAIAHQLTNCLHEIFFDQAIEEAKHLDEKIAAGHSPDGPLHGLPVSFKDQFHVRGVETTMGYLGWIGTFEGKSFTKERQAESELVRECKQLGAIPFCKTSLPHTVMSMETWNNIVGYTLNPHNRLTGSGGSSGGEGALIAMRGSPIGFGTDIGGSIRVPSAFCGLFGIRPSHGRLPYAGVANSMPGQNTIPSVCGPMSSSPTTLKLMMKSILSQRPWLNDPAVVELPWRDDLAASSNLSDDKLTFGIYKFDGLVNPLPPVKRALRTMIDLIHSLGYETVEWDPPSHTEATDIANEAWLQDGGIDIHHHIDLSNEPLLHRVADMYGNRPGPATLGNKIHETNLKQRAYQTRYMRYWNSTASLTKTGRPVDAIISPVTVFAALEPGKTAHIGYAPWVNVLDYTSVVIPVCKVDVETDKLDANYDSLNELDKAIHDEYDPQIQHGTPVGLQLVGRRFQEERMLALAEILHQASNAVRKTP